jgi:hypothetical protein
MLRQSRQLRLKSSTTNLLMLLLHMPQWKQTHLQISPSVQGAERTSFCKILEAKIKSFYSFFILSVPPGDRLGSVRLA